MTKKPELSVQWLMNAFETLDTNNLKLVQRIEELEKIIGDMDLENDERFASVEQNVDKLSDMIYGVDY